MNVEDTSLEPGQDTTELPEVQVSFEGVLRQMQRRAAGQVVQFLTENAELRATLETALAELGTYKSRCAALEELLGELTGEAVPK